MKHCSPRPAHSSQSATDSLRTTIAVSIIMILTITSTLAANDPGHDPLYVEQQGNSVLNGSLNISYDLQIANRLFSTYLDIIGNGTITGSANRILGTATDLYIESPGGDIIFNGLVGTSNMVRIGDSSGDNVNLNVTGNIYVDAGGDIVVDGVSVCLADGTNCQAVSGSSSAGGWTNTTILISSNVGDNITMDSGTLFVDATNNRVGIGTTTPQEDLHVSSSSEHAVIRIEAATNSDSAIQLYGDRDWMVFSDGDGTAGAADSFHIRDATGGATRILIDTSGNVGIGTIDPNSTLHVIGTGNFSGNLYEGTGRVCTATNGLCSDGTGTDDQTLQEVTASGSTTTDAVTIDSNGDGITIIGGDLNVSGTFNVTGNAWAGGSRICTPANGLCNNSGGGGSANAAGGWFNTTTQTHTNLSVGIGTAVPNETLTVVGESRLIGNQTWEIPSAQAQVCFERFVGTSQNYTRCINSTGHVIETLGVIDLS